MLSRFEALRSGATPLVGRDEELELLIRRWEQAKSGEGRVVLISGEPGIGKSRLTAALSEAGAAPASVARAGAWAFPAPGAAPPMSSRCPTWAEDPARSPASQ